MPLYIIYECCKCKIKDNFSIWSIKSDHGYSYDRYLCEHFDVDIDHKSNIGFLGIGWSNKIKVYVTYKKYGSRLELINYTFSRNDTEHEKHIEIDNVVIHARISDYKNRNPTHGNNIQRKLDIEYNAKLERQREEERRREEERDLQRQIDRMIEKGKSSEEQRKNELKILKEESITKRKVYQNHKKLSNIDFEKIFNKLRNKEILKTN